MKVKIRKGFSMKVGKDTVTGPAEVDVDPKIARANHHKLDLDGEEIPEASADEVKNEVPEPEPRTATKAIPDAEVREVPEPEPKETSFATPEQPNKDVPEPEPLEASLTGSEEGLPARDENPQNLVADQDSPSSPTQDPIHANPLTKPPEEEGDQPEQAEAEEPPPEEPKKKVRKKKASK